VTDNRASERDIGFVFQLFALYPHLNVRREHRLSAEMQASSAAEIKRRVEEVARCCGSSICSTARCRVLSGGDRQRVALGRAIVRAPKGLHDG
jgi:multiple sugar transport system ATP-binding protein